MFSSFFCRHFSVAPVCWQGTVITYMHAATPLISPPAQGGMGSVPDNKGFTVGRVKYSRMGREARQGEIGVVVDGTYYGITEYAEI